MSRAYMTHDVAGALGDHPVQRGVGPGLLADKYPYMPAGETRQRAKSQTIEAMCRAETPDLDWQRLATSLTPPRSIRFHAALQGRLIVDQAGGVVENAGLCLHRTFGVPRIPGTAVKGIARAAAIESLASAPAAEKAALLARVLVVFGFSAVDLQHRRRVEDCSDLLQAFFGDMVPTRDLPVPGPLAGTDAFGGVVSFLPALPTGRMRIVADIVTCHHPKYYGGQQAEPFDNEDPIPNPFPVAEAAEGEAGHFSFTLALLPRWLRLRSAFAPTDGLGPSFDPLVAAKEWLAGGITRHGVGAKTAAGYGWFDYDPDADQALREDAEDRARRVAEQKARAAAEAARLASLSPEERRAEELGRLGDQEFIEKVKALPTLGEAEQRAVLMALRSAKRSLWDKDRKAKPSKKAGQRAEIVRRIAADLGESMP